MVTFEEEYFDSIPQCIPSVVERVFMCIPKRFVAYCYGC